jgi:hypothetical protein
VLGVDTRRIHLFDCETGRSLASPS